MTLHRGSSYLGSVFPLRVPIAGFSCEDATYDAVHARGVVNQVSTSAVVVLRAEDEGDGCSQCLHELYANFPPRVVAAFILRVYHIDSEHS